MVRLVRLHWAAGPCSGAMSRVHEAWHGRQAKQGGGRWVYFHIGMKFKPQFLAGGGAHMDLGSYPMVLRDVERRPLLCCIQA